MAAERIQVVLYAKNIKALEGLDIDNGCMPFRQNEDDSIEMIATVTRATLEKLRKKRSVTVEIDRDPRADASQAHKDVSRTNRYADGSLPIPLGIEGVRHVD